LLEIPASRKDLCKAPLHSSLQEALNTLNSNDAEALYITREISSINQRVYGVLTRSAIESYFRPIKK
jgi:hypothetical protein